MALKFSRGAAIPITPERFAKLEALRKRVEAASAAVDQAILAARQLGGMNNWVERITPNGHNLDLIAKDIYELLHNN